MITLANLLNKLPENIYFFVDAHQTLSRIKEEQYLIYANTKQQGKLQHMRINEITISNFTMKLFDQQQIKVDSVDFKRGNLYVIDGVSGSGKSTLCDILAGISCNYEGEIMVNNLNSDKNDKYSYLSHIGYALQQTDIFTGTLLENIQMQRQTEKEWETLIYRVCGINEILLKYQNQTMNGSLNTLSGGEKQRVGIARALYCNPDVIILDDVFTALDTNTRTGILRFLIEHKSEHITIIVSDYEDVLKAADQIINL